MNSMNYWLHSKDETLGPFRAEELLEMCRCGKIAPSDAVCEVGSDQWTEVKDLAYFSAAVQELAPPPPPPGKKSQSAEIAALSAGDLSQLKGKISDHFAPAAKIVGPVSAVAGFIADVLQPLAPFAAILFFTSFLITAVYAYLIWRNWSRRRTFTGNRIRILTYATVASIVFGAMWLVFTGRNPSEGFFSKKIPGIASMQSSLLGIEQSVARVESTVNTISGDVKSIAIGVGEIGKAGGLIKNPETAMEFYHNAKVYAGRGDLGSELKMLTRYVETGEQCFTPYQRFITQAHERLGKEGTTKLLRELAEKDPQNAFLQVILAKYSLKKPEDWSDEIARLFSERPDSPIIAHEYLGQRPYMSEELIEGREKIRTYSTRDFFLCHIRSGPGLRAHRYLSRRYTLFRMIDECEDPYDPKINDLLDEWIGAYEKVSSIYNTKSDNDWASKSLMSHFKYDPYTGEDIDSEPFALTADPLFDIYDAVTRRLEELRTPSDTEISDELVGSHAGELRKIGGIEMVWCPPGRFVMGSPKTEAGRVDNENQHEVMLTRGFWLAKAETSAKQWRLVLGKGLSKPSQADDLPISHVSWNEVQMWIEKMNDRHPLPSGWRWSLPTEAQWEYACRAGTTTAHAVELSELAWYDNNPGKRTPAQVKPNAWGLYDMHGNVSEWCQDWYDENYHESGQTDPVGPRNGLGRVLRGGSYFYGSQFARSALRNYRSPVYMYTGERIGFRAAVLVPSRSDTR